MTIKLNTSQKVFKLFIFFFFIICTQLFSQIQIGLDIDGEAAGDKSGTSVALSSDGTIVAIGADVNAGNGNRAGHTRIYQYSGGSWSQLGSDIDAEAAGDLSGTSVALSSDGTIVAIGAYVNGGNGEAAGPWSLSLSKIENWSLQIANIDTFTDIAAGENSLAICCAAEKLSESMQQP